MQPTTNVDLQSSQGFAAETPPASPLPMDSAEGRTTVKLPRTGKTREGVKRALDEMRKDDADWRSGRTFSLVYFAGDDVIEVLRDAASTFIMENGLSPLAFPSLKKLENDLISMTADLLHAPRATGSLTTGGTESILMAVKTARDWGRAVKGLAQPN
jgi:sphinganine-1-phosphate aldolase